VVIEERCCLSNQGHRGADLREREGGNGYRLRLWKVELQRWAEETGLVVTVRHLPPGTSKWNKDCASALLAYQYELERVAGGESGGGGTDRGDHNADGADGRRQAGQEELSTTVKVSAGEMASVNLEPQTVYGE